MSASRMMAGVLLSTESLSKYPKAHPLHWLENPELESQQFCVFFTGSTTLKKEKVGFWLMARTSEM